ncbi:MAG: hypothetical protein AAFZ58_08565 [Pseudomonadota bacterium]
MPDTYPPSAVPATSRYELALTHLAGGVTLNVVDRWTGLILLRCDGDVARYAAAILGVNSANDITLAIDKATVRSLSLRVTAKCLAEPTPISDPLSASDRLLLSLMQDLPGVHFSAARVRLLLDFHGINTPNAEVDAALGRLTIAGRLRCIRIGRTAFFDTNTDAHWHIFDTATEELHDLTLTNDQALNASLVAQINASASERFVVVRD